MANATLPESEAPEKQDQSAEQSSPARRNSPYDSQSRSGDINQVLSPGSAPLPAQPSGPGQRLRLPRTSAPTSRPSQRDVQSMKQSHSSPTRPGRPRYSRNEPSSTYSPTGGSQTSLPGGAGQQDGGTGGGRQPENQGSNTETDGEPENNDVEPEEQPVNLDQEEPVYDEPGIGEPAENDSASPNPAKNPAAGRVSQAATKPTKTAPSRSDVADKEKSGGDHGGATKPESEETEKLGRGYTGNPNDIGKRGDSLYRRILKTNARKAALGLPIGGGLLALFFAIFIALAPLKLLSIVTNLENRFFSSANHAMEKESEKLFEGYIKKRLIVLGSCRGKIDIECNPYKLNPVKRMWKGWANRRLEEKMANKFGITFEAKIGTLGTKDFYVKFPGMQGDGAKVNDFVTGNAELDDLIANSPEGQRIKLTRNQVRKVIATALKDANLYDRTAFKYKFLQMMAEKYGLRFCVLFCKPKDALSDKITGVSRSDAYKLSVTERVQMKRLQIVQQGFKCVFKVVPGCSSDDTPKFQPCREGVDCELGGVATTDMELAVQAALRDAAATLGLESAAELKTVKDFEAAAKAKGFDNDMIDRQLADIIGTKEGASKLIPIIGWISIAAVIVDAGVSAGPAIRHLAYLANTTMAASYFQTLATTSHECKSGHCNGDELASFSDAFNHSSTDKDGGTASAEESPLYNKYLGNGELKGNKTAIKCKDNKPLLSSGICPEEQMAQGNAIFDDIRNFLEQEPFKIIVQMAKAWNGFFDFFFHLVFSAFGWLISPILSAAEYTANNIFCPLPSLLIPPPLKLYCKVKDLVKKAIPHVVEFFQKHVVPSAFSLTMSGARNFNFAAAGADVLGNDTVRNVMGGTIAAASDIQALQQEQYQQDLADYQSQPLLKRMFDTQSQFSPVTKLAMAMPANGTSLSYGALNMFSNPFGSLSSVFGNIFNRHAVAQSTQDGDPFGILQYNVPDKVIDKIGPDQDVFWEKYCSDDKQVANGAAARSYAQQAEIDKNTGMPINKPSNSWNPDKFEFYGTNPCLIIQAALCPNSTFNDDMVCTSEDQNGNEASGTTNNSASGSSGGSSSSSSGGGTTITGSCSGGGQYAAIVGAGANFAGVDQGIDFTPASSSGFDICTPGTGTITLADQTGHQFDKTSGQAEVIIKLDADPKVPWSSQYVYFAEIIQIDGAIRVGVHIPKGTVIGHNSASPGIEVGWAPDATHGFPCSKGGPTVCGYSFDSWIKAGGGT